MSPKAVLKAQLKGKAITKTKAEHKEKSKTGKESETSAGKRTARSMRAFSHRDLSPAYNRACCVAGSERPTVRTVARGAGSLSLRTTL